jgi:hypothetical protein
MTTANATTLATGLTGMFECRAPAYTCEDAAFLAPPAASVYQLNIAVVCQDAATREWARQVVAHATRLVGDQCVQTEWWSTDQLEEPLLLLRAAQAAGLADMVVAALRCDGSLPAAVCDWLESGLARRARRNGALVALLGSGEEPSVAVLHAQFYLASLARDSGLDFLPCQQRLPAALPEAHEKMLSAAA